MRPKTRGDFEIAIICALPWEADAIEALVDEHYDELGHSYSKQQGDANTYTTGRIGKHYIVLVFMPGIGKRDAAGVTSSLKISFVGIKLALLVGICGGIPFPSQDETEVILGDIIINDSIIEYDFGTQYPHGFQRTSDIRYILGPPERSLRSFLSKLKSRRSRKALEGRTFEYVQRLQGKNKEYQYPGAKHDILFEASYRHKHYLTDECICTRCKSTQDPVCEEALTEHCNKVGCQGNSIQRRRLIQTGVPPRPLIHFGTIASADRVMKSGEHRDKMAEGNGIVGYEMEGAGVWDHLPCIIIKGVAHYADGHKNSGWQDYAAATAASCTKAFLQIWIPTSQESELFLIRERCLRTQPLTCLRFRLDEGPSNQKKANSRPSVKLFSVPVSRNPQFSGRESQLRELDTLTEHDSTKCIPYPIVAVYGLGGIGYVESLRVP